MARYAKMVSYDRAESNDHALCALRVRCPRAIAPIDSIKYHRTQFIPSYLRLLWDRQLPSRNDIVKVLGVSFCRRVVVR